MKRVLLASALALASVSLSPAGADSLGTEVEKGAHRSERATLVISEAQISQFKTALKLTPAQEQLWIPIEAEFRLITRTGLRSDSDGIVQRIRSRFRTIVLDVAALRRLGDVARPLLMSLDDDQKQKALQIARTMGMSSLASVF